LATQLVNKYTWRARCHYQLGCCSVWQVYFCNLHMIGWLVPLVLVI
jgi:hypothetical protein